VHSLVKEATLLGTRDDGGISDVVQRNPSVDHLVCKFLYQLKLFPKPQRLHCDIVEDGFHGKQILGLDPIHKKKSLLPWLQGVEYQQHVFSSKRARNILQTRQEFVFRGTTLIQFVSKAFQISQLWTVGVSSALLSLRG